MGKPVVDRQGIAPLAAVAVVYSALFALWLLLRLIFFDRFWPLALVNTFAEYLFIPLPFLAALAFWQRRWRLLLPLLVPGAAFLFMFGELFLPSFPAPSVTQPQDRPTLIAMSFNVLWSNEDYDAIAGAVRAASSDIVGFEELHRINVGRIHALLEAEYPYNTFDPPDQINSVGLLSRFPIESAEPFSLPPRDLALHAIIDFNGARVHVFVVHLSPNNFGLFPLDQFMLLAEDRYTSRAAEAVRLEEIIKPIDEPVIMLCDCNLTDTSQAYARLSSFLQDSFREAGWGFGHTLTHPPHTFRTQRLDYVWNNAAFTAAEAAVGQEGGSDHLPVAALLVLTKAP